MALPTTIDPTAPLGTASAALGDDQLRALKLAITDFLGIPVDPTSLTAAAFAITAAGVVTVSQTGFTITGSAPATPTANVIYRDSIVESLPAAPL